jgi:hypothetical protein
MALLFSIIIVAALFYVAVKVSKRLVKGVSVPTRICRDCGSKGAGKRVTPGNILIELLLWCFLLIPGLLYSAWRMTARRTVCSVCGSSNLIPLDSPIGRQIDAAGLHPSTTPKLT